MTSVCALTGASGYVGSRLAEHLRESFDVVALSRKPSADDVQWEMAATRDIAVELKQRGVGVMVHCAWDFSRPRVEENEQVNVEGSRRLLRSAVEAGVRRFVFVSSISAFEGCRSNYGRSKLRVERMFLDAGGIVLRPGLVWGASPGGMFGALSKQVASSAIVPLIGSGRYPQYLVHEDDLGEAVRLAATGALANADAPITMAHPQPWLFRDLLRQLARSQGRRVKLVPLPWPVLYASLKLAEAAGIRLGFRSDSVLSLVYQNPSPDFSSMEFLKLDARPLALPTR